MVEEFDDCSLILQIVALHSAERVDKFETLAIVEGIVDLQRCWLHVRKAFLIQVLDSFCNFWNQARNLRRPVGRLDVEHLFHNMDRSL